MKGNEHFKIPKKIPGQLIIETKHWKFIANLQTDNIKLTLADVDTRETASFDGEYEWVMQLYEQVKKIALQYLEDTKP